MKMLKSDWSGLIWTTKTCRYKTINEKLFESHMQIRNCIYIFLLQVFLLLPIFKLLIFFITWFVTMNRFSVTQRFGCCKDKHTVDIVQSDIFLEKLLLLLFLSDADFHWPWMFCVNVRVCVAKRNGMPWWTNQQFHWVVGETQVAGLPARLSASIMLMWAAGAPRDVLGYHSPPEANACRAAECSLNSVFPLVWGKTRSICVRVGVC